MLRARRLSTVLLPALAAVLIAACGSSNSSSSSSAGASSSAAAAAGTSSSSAAGACTKSTLALHSPGVLTVATDSPAYPPYFEDNKPSNGKGFESAVAYAIGKKLGFAPAR